MLTDGMARCEMENNACITRFIFGIQGVGGTVTFLQLDGLFFYHKNKEGYTPATCLPSGGLFIFEN